MQIYTNHQGPIVPGEFIELQIQGDGPFTIISSCFVDSPPPTGFRPCTACNTTRLSLGEGYSLSADPDFWQGRRGNIRIEISSPSETEERWFEVLSDAQGAARATSIPMDA